MQRIIVCALISLLLAGCGGTGEPRQTSATASFRVTLALDAARFGDRTATVEVHDLAGNPVHDAQVTIVPTMPSDGMASPEAVARPAGDGRYQAPKSIALTMLGEWHLDVRITAQGKTEVARFVWQVTGDGGWVIGERVNVSLIPMP
jgi:nitrogen fixation protein FixH